jgi:hypothetical protein
MIFLTHGVVMLTFDDFFNAYPATPWKSRLKFRARKEFERLLFSHDQIKEIINKLNTEKRLIEFSKRTGISYPDPLGPDKYLRDKVYNEPLHSEKDLIISASKFHTLSKSVIMLSEIPVREKEILRFMLAIASFIPDFFQKNKYSFYKKDGFFRVCPEIVKKLNGFTMRDMKQILDYLSNYQNIPKNGLTISYVIFLLNKNRIEKNAPVYKQLEEEDIVTRQLRLINQKFPEYQLEMEKCKNSKEMRKVHSHFERLLTAQNPAC